MKRNRFQHEDRIGLAAAILSISLVVGCRSGERPAGGETTQTGAPPAAAAPAGGAAAADSARALGAAAGGGAGGAGAITPAQVAAGDSIFHGQLAGGTCFACHGPDGKGTGAGPDLTDSEWLNSDGSYEALVTTVTDGVPKPKKYPAPMLPMGGSTLTPEQVRAVAAYEYSLSHPSK